MKKLFSIIFFLLSINGFTQIYKGATVLGLGGGFSYSRTSPSEITYTGNNYYGYSTSISVSPSYGKAIKNNFVIRTGINLGYHRAKSVNYSEYLNFSIERTSKRNSKYGGVNFGIDKYWNLKPKLSFLTSLDISNSFRLSNSNNERKTTQINGDSETEFGDDSDFNISLFVRPQAGLNYMLTNSVAIRALLYYDLLNGNTSQDDFLSGRTRLGLDFSLAFFINNNPPNQEKK